MRRGPSLALLPLLLVRGPSLALLPLLVRGPILALLPLLLVVGTARAQPDTALEAELLVRQLYYEGLPYEQAQRFDAPG